MNTLPENGITEISHTADVALHISANSLEQLFTRAAEGMYALAGIETDRTNPILRKFVVSGIDPESLLVAFLSELLFILEEEKIGFHNFDVEISTNSVLCKLIGSPLVSQRKPIKAVTFHNLKIQRTSAGCATTLTFDV